MIINVTISTTRSLFDLFEENRGTIKNLGIYQSGFSLLTYNGQTYPDNLC